MLKTGKDLKKWIDEIANEKFGSAADLPKFCFEVKNFENIPQIVTKFLFSLHAQVQCLSKH
jgi:hypothetical protein